MAELNALDGTSGTLPIAAGGTAKASFTAYTVVCAGTTTTGALQNVASVGTSGYPLASNGAGALPSFQSLSSLNIASLTAADQTLSGGANVTASNQGTKSSGTYTVDCGACPLQYITNGGAFTLEAPANDGSMMLLVTNNGSAGAITFSGFTVGSSTGDALTTTNTNKFTISIWRINGTSGYRIAAHQ